MVLHMEFLRVCCTSAATLQAEFMRVFMHQCGDVPFIRAEDFIGCKAGYVFHLGGSGLGYYIDSGRRMHPSLPLDQFELELVESGHVGVPLQEPTCPGAPLRVGVPLQEPTCSAAPLANGLGLVEPGHVGVPLQEPAC